MSGIMLMLVGGKGGEAPVNTVAPALSDSTPEIGQTISVSDGTWTSLTTPTFTYQWQRNGSNIGGETSDSYTVVEGDYGDTLRCVVTATNPFGSNSENSNTSSAVPGAAPVNTVAPALSDTTPVEGQELTVTTGTWTGTPSPTFTYQWQANGSNISGATSSSYTVEVAYVGNTIRCVVTATNAEGSASANSNTSSAVVARTGSYLMVAGGGGGGYDAGGGGGAGGMITGTKTGGWTGTISITVGSGGAGDASGPTGGGDGNTSAISGIGTVTGGGGGGSNGNPPGHDGGSGGASRRTSTDVGQGAPGQGNDGGSTGGQTYGSGGGGGKGTDGFSGANNVEAGPGGTGGISNIHGANRYYAGGGGGGSDQPTPGGTGGAGGGGDGGSRGLSIDPTAGYVNTGGGGGGGANGGANGGSGIVIIRSNLPAYNTVGSPDITTDGADTIYTFNGSGSLQFE